MTLNRQGPPVQFRPGDTLESGLTERARDGESPGLVAARDLERYYRVLQDELARLALSEPEASLIVDSLNGTLIEPHTYRLLWAEVADSELGQKWGVDLPGLSARLRALSPGACMAVVDAAERFWRDTTAETGARLRAVGLVRDRRERS